MRWKMRSIYKFWFLLPLWMGSCALVMDIPNPPNTCGDLIRQNDEVCDGTDLGGATCASLGLGEGTLVCNLTCTGFITDGCTPEAFCGNDVLESGEVCDGSDLNDTTCETLGFVGGQLACNTDCANFDILGCYYCGNQRLDPGEVCDGSDLHDTTCETLGFVGGQLACNTDCSDFSTSGCHYCGNQSLEPGEVCDSTNLRNATCETLGFVGGQLACKTDCSDFDISGCHNCGNGTIDEGETCDDRNTLIGDGCNNGCQVEMGWQCVDTEPSRCDPICGDGLLRGYEPCDDGNRVTSDGCDEYCHIETGWICTGEPSVCDPVCGDNLALGAEVCDGTDLKLRDCSDFGYCGGTLQCKTDCRSFDVSLCSDQMCK